jgi:hypothetical protein
LSRTLAEAEIASRGPLKDSVLAFERDLSVEALDEGGVAAAGEYAAKFLDPQAAIQFCIPALRHVEIQNTFVLIQNP